MYWFLGILGAIGVVVLYAFVAKWVRRYVRERDLALFKQLKPQRFSLKLSNLPFEPDVNQVIYVESEYDEVANAFIRRHHRRISRYFKSRGYSFCYLPLLASQFNKEVYKYHKPLSGNVRTHTVWSDYLLNYLTNPKKRSSIRASLLYLRDNTPLDGGDVVMHGLRLGDISKLDRRLKWLLKFIIEEQKDLKDKQNKSTYEHKPKPSPSVSEEEIWGQEIKQMSSFGFPPFGLDEGGSYSYSLNLDRVRPRYEADDWFDDEAKQLVEEVAERVEKLQQKGLSRYLLEQMIFGTTKPSKMVITHDFRIFLPDYNNMEIVMTPLVKAVFILFLNHPEGIVFKSLPDYRSELLHIYMSIRGLKEATIDISRSVAAVTNPFDNSINEKCARIREAFVEHFDEELAKHYFVTGKRGEPKAITLSRDLVVWE